MQATTTMLQVLCFDVSKTCGEALERVLACLPHRITFLYARDEGPASVPGSRPRRGATPRSLGACLRGRVPGWAPDDPVLLLARGEAIERVDEWLAPEDARELVAALVLLDDQPRPEPVARLGRLVGIAEFARDALADPGEKLLIAASIGREPLDANGAAAAGRLRRALEESEGRALGPEPRLCIRSFPTQPRLDRNAGGLPGPFLALLESDLLPFLRELGPASAPDRYGKS